MKTYQWKKNSTELTAGGNNDADIATPTKEPKWQRTAQSSFRSSIAHQSNLHCLLRLIVLHRHRMAKQSYCLLIVVLDHLWNRKIRKRFRRVFQSTVLPFPVLEMKLYYPNWFPRLMFPNQWEILEINEFNSMNRSHWILPHDKHMNKPKNSARRPARHKERSWIHSPNTIAKIGPWERKHHSLHSFISIVSNHQWWNQHRCNQYHWTIFQ